MPTSGRASSTPGELGWPPKTAGASALAALRPAHVVGAALFLVLFSTPIQTLISAWWADADSSGGFLLVGAAGYLAWTSGVDPSARPQRLAGCVLLAVAIGLRIGAESAAEYYTLRLSLLVALIAATVYFSGYRQVRIWSLSFLLILLAIPLPTLLFSSIAWPLQLASAKAAAWLLALRGIYIDLDQNLIGMPGQVLVVTEGCSGIRSTLTLFALSAIASKMWLGSRNTRALLNLAVLPTALSLNAVRIFLTGFLMYFVAPEYGQGRLHTLAGYITFILSLMVLGAILHGLESLERRGGRQHG